MKDLLKHLIPLTITLLAYFAPPGTSTVCATDYDISMTADGFVPAYLEVTVGDTVYWWNDDYDFGDDHSTHSYTYAWNSGPVRLGFGAYLTMTKVGTFDYVDDVGLSGYGTLVVKPSGPPPAHLIPAPNRM